LRGRNLRQRMIKIGVLASRRRMDHYQQTLGSFSVLNLAGYLDTDDKANYNQEGQLLYAADFLSRVDAVIVDRYISLIPEVLIRQLLRSGKHVLADGFLLSNPEVLQDLMELNHEARVVFQVAGSAFAKPVFQAAKPLLKEPQLIKLEKYTPSLPVGNFDRWLHFTMCNELDLALRIIRSDVKAVKAKPVFMFSNHPDLINVHVEFQNGSVFQMSFGRIPSEDACLMRVYSRDRFYRIDLDRGSIRECRLLEEDQQLGFDLEEWSHPIGKRFEEIERTVPWFDPWKAEIKSFVEHITLDRKPATGLEEMHQVAELVREVKHQLSRNYVFE